MGGQLWYLTMCEILVVPNAIPESSARTLQQLVLSLDTVTFDVYANPFESKLQLPKHMHSYPVVKHVLDILRSPLTTTLLGNYFDIYEPMPDTNQYHSALFIYRIGDFLKRHYDCAIHNNDRKVITLLLYLSDCEGGHLYINKVGPIHPEFNTLVAFTNTDDAWHEVTPITGGQRIVLTTALLVPRLEQVSHMTRTNTRAQFVPREDEEWTPQMYTLANERQQ